MDNGSIIEQGTYEVHPDCFRPKPTHDITQDLMASGIMFSHLMEEYGNFEAEADANSHLSSKREVKIDAKIEDSMEGDHKKNSNTNMASLMQTEERNTGAVTWTVYQKYLGFAGGMIWAPIIVLLLMLTQGAQGVF